VTRIEMVISVRLGTCCTWTLCGNETHLVIISRHPIEPSHHPPATLDPVQPAQNALGLVQLFFAPRQIASQKQRISQVTQRQGVSFGSRGWGRGVR
jgi:hypothetical protein